MRFHLREIFKNTFLEFLKWHINTNIKKRISEGKKDKIKKAFESNSKYITIRFQCSDLYGEDVVALTKSQVDRLVEIYEEKKGLTIRMSKTQLAHNAKKRMRIFPSISWIDSISNWNCLTSFRSWSFIRIGEYRGTKTNWKWVVSKERKWCASDRNWWRMVVSWTGKR